MPYKDKEYLKKWRELNKDYLRECDNRYYQNNKNNTEFKLKKNAYAKKYYEKNKKRILRRIKENYWNLSDQKRIELNERNKKYLRKRRKVDKNFLIKCKLRTAVRRAFRKFIKKKKICSSKKYGINYKAIIEHLKPFPKDLGNYEIHHIKPLFTFNFINKDGSINLKEISNAFSPENHRLLLTEEHKEIHRRLKK